MTLMEVKRAHGYSQGPKVKVLLGWGRAIDWNGALGREERIDHERQS